MMAGQGLTLPCRCMTTTSELLHKIHFILQDDDGVRWDDDEIVMWLNEAMVCLAAYPGAYTKTETLDLVEGTRQSLPDDTWSLQTIARNVDSEGIPTKPVRLVTRALLDSFNPGWHMDPPSPEVENYVYDDREPKVWWCYPPNDGTGHVQATYSAVPEGLEYDKEAGVDSVVPVDVSYIPSMVDYAVYRCQCKDSDYAPGANAAQAFFNSASVNLQTLLQQRGQTTPNAIMTAGTPVNPNGGTE